MDNTIMYILQAITIFITFISLVINYRLTKSENKKQRMVEITVRERLEEMNSLKHHISEFLSLINISNVEIEDKKEYCYKLLLSYYECINLLKINYNTDKELYDLLSEAKDKAIKYNHQSSKTELSNQFDELSNKIYEKISIYTYSNWCCIKEQAKGIELKSVNYKEIYKKNKVKFKL